MDFLRDLLGYLKDFWDNFRILGIFEGSIGIFQGFFQLFGIFEGFYGIFEDLWGFLRDLLGYLKDFCDNFRILWIFEGPIGIFEGFLCISCASGSWRGAVELQTMLLQLLVANTVH